MIPSSFAAVVRAHLDELQAQRSRAAGLAARWDRILTELRARRAQYEAVTLVRRGFDAKIADAAELRQQMQDVVAGLDVLIGIAVEQGPPTVGALGALPALALPAALVVASVAGYGVVHEITDYLEIVDQNETKVGLAEKQLGIVQELTSALATCDGDQCAKVAEALYDVSKRPLTADPGWPWWMWALVLGLPVVGGVIAWWLLSGDT